MKGRGLCGACRSQSERGVFSLADFPPTQRSRDDVLDGWADLHVVGVDDVDIAARLGMTVPALTIALRRARAAGDRRVAALEAS